MAMAAPKKLLNSGTAINPPLGIYPLLRLYYLLKYKLLNKKPNGISLVCISILFSVICVLRASRSATKGPLTKLRFIWHNLISPTRGQEHRERIDNFYKGQADIYDETRKGLLKGREDMLRLSAAQLMESRKTHPECRFVWVDVGGGTGYNIEAMNEFLPIYSFDAIYLVDICESLLEVARKRFASRGWDNVHILHQDCAQLILPEPGWTAESPLIGSVSFVSLSYSLSMIPDFYAILDRISTLLSPDGGLISVVDFYTSGSITKESVSAANTGRECAWLSRWFWQIWFDFDRVILGPERRDYLEHKFDTLKSFNGRNRLIVPFMIRIPYYIWLGRIRACPVRGKQTSISTNTHVKQDMVLEHSVGVPGPWRMSYKLQPSHADMKTFVYAFTWEDPLDDMKYLNIGTDDSLLVITSAGDNVLHYALKAKPKYIHCVDFNPCQGHILELKMAALKVLPFDDFFSMFGLGHLDSFQDILDLKLSPLLSQPCYQFWKANANMFSPSSPLYSHGFSGFALRVVRALFRVTRCGDAVEQLCNADTIAEQEQIWRERVRPVILSRLAITCLNNPAFCWTALGVPKNQRNMLLSEGTAYDFIKDTLDPVVSSGLFKEGAYHYLVALQGHYTPSSCPLYLTRESFEILREEDAERLDSIKIHTDTITGALKTIQPSSLSRAILMDHLDWFSEDSTEVEEEIALLYRTIQPGGFIILRSAARSPWYIKRFTDAGFEASCLKIRESGSKIAMDRVNMYASFWQLNKRVF